MADDEIDSGNGALLLNAGLGVTAGYRHKGIGGMSQRLADHVSAGPFRILCHGAGVYDEQVCRLTELDDPIAIAP